MPSPPDLVVTMISPLSSLAGPTRHTILLADIHSAVSRQLWPQMDRPEVDGEEGRTVERGQDWVQVQQFEEGADVPHTVQWEHLQIPTVLC